MRLRKILVAAQVTLSLLLLIGAGLFVKTLRNLRDTDPGFRIERLVTFKIDPPLNGYTARAQPSVLSRTQRPFERSCRSSCGEPYRGSPAR